MHNLFVALSTLVVLALPATSRSLAISAASLADPGHTEVLNGAASLLNIDLPTQHPENFQGWTAQPNGRGTIDIIWSCTFTIFLCSWSALCLNVPAEKDSYFKINWRKFMLAGLCNMGPEFLLQLALGQWISARRSMKQFHASGYAGWTMNHAFFADMGGFILKTRDWVPFPINAKQLHYLVERNYLPYPTVTRAEIKDRNKVDGLLRAITVFQTLWFLLNCLARVGQRIALTTFELTTVGFVFCTFGTYLCWAHKPADVQVPIILYTHDEACLQQILLDAGKDADGSYGETPLDFITREEWSFSRWWSLLLNVFRVMHIRIQPTLRPIARIPNDNWPELPSGSVFIMGLVDMCYAAIYMAGWNFKFATEIEQLLWRVSTTIIMGIVVAYLVVELYTFHLVPSFPDSVRGLFRVKSSPTQLSASERQGASRVRRTLDWIRNSSLNKDPQLYMPLKASIPISVASVIYGVARAYILVECVVALRSLPSSAYESVNWSMFIPHV